MAATRLVIVESPSKARKIAGFLGNGWQVLASRGHVRDLPPKALGVDVGADFAPTYEVVKGKGPVVKELKDAAKAASEIYLATDPDREGEAIAWHICEAIAREIKGKPVFRATFTEITAAAVRRAFAQPRQIDRHLVDAQQARRVLDRLVGWEVSPVLRRAFGTGGLSAGRVQSVAVRLVVERERIITSFVPEEYWTLDALLARQEGARERFLARLVALLAPADKELDPQRLPAARAKAIAAELGVGGLGWRVTDVATKERRRMPPPPFITSTLQQSASSKLGMAPGKTMRAAQSLYEAGKITYHRTDAPAVSAEAQQAARAVIARLFGADGLPERPPHYKAKGSNAQEAHECVRPTDPALLPKEAKLSGDEEALYRLIWMRFIASQMAAALYDVTTAEIEVRQGSQLLPYGFRATGRVLRFPGWLSVYGVKAGTLDEGDEREEGEQAQALPPLVAGEPVELLEMRPTEHWTQPPPRYTEAALIKALEEHGVGRPSTYASIMETIRERGYVARQKKVLVPTEAGNLVTDFLVAQFPDLLDLDFTAQMEGDLDRVAEGAVGWTSLMGSFYQPFHTRVVGAKSATPGPSLAEPCPKCGQPLAQRYGRFGGYTLCEGCGYKPGGPEAVGRQCPECQQPLVSRTGRYGTFVGCSGYPTCRYIEARQQTKGAPATSEAAPGTPLPGEGEPCPQCSTMMVAKSGRYGPFVACPNYPTCKYIHKSDATALPAKGRRKRTTPDEASASGSASPARGRRKRATPAGEAPSEGRKPGSRKAAGGSAASGRGKRGSTAPLPAEAPTPAPRRGFAPRGAPAIPEPPPFFDEGRSAGGDEWAPFFDDAAGQAPSAGRQALAAPEPPPFFDEFPPLGEVSAPPLWEELHFVEPPPSAPPSRGRKPTKTPASAPAGGSAAGTASAGQPCPKCGSALVEKSGRYGPFLGCSGYPKCRYIHKG